MAEDLGKRLVGGVEEVGVGEILSALRLQDDVSTPPSYFGFPPLDRLLQACSEGRPQANKTPPVVELTSLHAGGGATHLLYHLTALAVLPRDQSGKQSCAIIFDTDSRFDIDRLVAQLQSLIRDGQETDDLENEKETITQALRHIHIFRLQSLRSLTATLDSLPSYLFNATRHFSFDRTVGFIAISSVSAFYWSDRAETEDAAFFAKTSGGPAPESGYVALASAVKKASATLQCPMIFTSWHLSPVSTTQSHGTRSYRPSLPAPFATLPTLRLAGQRVPVKKFPPLISAEGATREASDRIKAVEEGRFECFVNEWGVEERVLRRLQGAVCGFEFKIEENGVTIL